MEKEIKRNDQFDRSDKVKGTSVFGADETRIGSIERVMIDKGSGKVSYAVLSFPGIGDDHTPAVGVA